MPIQPASQWAALATRTCLWCLVIETVRFGEAHRLLGQKGPFGQLTLTSEGATVDATKLGARVPPSPGTRFV
jgi:hypothetical protein